MKQSYIKELQPNQNEIKQFEIKKERVEIDTILFVFIFELDKFRTSYTTLVIFSSRRFLVYSIEFLASLSYLSGSHLSRICVVNLVTEPWLIADLVGRNPS